MVCVPKSIFLRPKSEKAHDMNVWKERFNMCEKYDSLEIEIIRFNEEDVVKTSFWGPEGKYNEENEEE